MDVHTQGLDVSGLDDLAGGLSAMSVYAESASLKAGGRAAAQTIVDRAIELVPVASGKLKAAIRVRAGRSGQGGFAFLASCGARYYQGPEFYGGFQEFGWKAGKRGNANRHQIQGEHFMQYAAEEVGQSAMDTFVATVKKQIEAELNK